MEEVAALKDGFIIWAAVQYYEQACLMQLHQIQKEDYRHTTTGLPATEEEVALAKLLVERVSEVFASLSEKQLDGAKWNSC